MPIMNGWEFLDEFVKLSITNKPQVYIVSSHFGLEEIEKAKGYDMVKDFISKPLLDANLTKIFESIR